MSDDNTNPLTQPTDDSIRKLLFDIQAAMQLRDTNEALRRELIEAKQKLEKYDKSPDFKTFAFFYDNWCVVQGFIRPLHIYNGIRYYIDTPEDDIEVISPVEFLTKIYIRALLTEEDDEWVIKYWVGLDE